MGVPLRAARPAWQPLDSPLWQATPRDEVTPLVATPAVASVGDWSRLDGLRCLDRRGTPRSAGASSSRTSRPRSAGSAWAALEAAKAQGEAARAAAEATMAAAQLIVQDTSRSGLELHEERRQPALRQLRVGPVPTASVGPAQVRASPASMVQDFLRSLDDSQELSDLDRRMEVSLRPLGVQQPGRWTGPTCGPTLPTSAQPRCEERCREPDAAAPSLQDFLKALHQATQDFEIAVGASPRGSSELEPGTPHGEPRGEPPRVPFARPSPDPDAEGAELAAPRRADGLRRSRPEPAPSAPTLPEAPMGHLAAMAAFVQRQSWKLPAVPQKTALPLVKETLRLREKKLWSKAMPQESVKKLQALPPLKSASTSSLRPCSDRGKRDSKLRVFSLRTSRSTGAL